MPAVLALRASSVPLLHSLARGHWAGALTFVFCEDRWYRSLRRDSSSGYRSVLGMVRAPLCPSTLATVCRSAECSAFEEGWETPVPRDPAVSRYLLDKTGCICLPGCPGAIKSLKSSGVIQAFLAHADHRGRPDWSRRLRRQTHVRSPS
jgi:hypothetical protein